MMLNVCDGKEKRGQLMSNMYRIAEFLCVVGCQWGRKEGR